MGLTFPSTLSGYRPLSLTSLTDRLFKTIINYIFLNQIIQGQSSFQQIQRRRRVEKASRSEHDE
jgi:hypothetical protein